MKTYDNRLEEFIETPREMEEFLGEIKSISEKYDLSIAHEDIEGGFIIERYKDSNIDWLQVATKGY